MKLSLNSGYLHGSLRWETAEPDNSKGQTEYTFRPKSIIRDDPDEAIILMARALIFRTLQDYMLALSSTRLDPLSRMRLCYDVADFFESGFYELLAEFVPELKLNKEQRGWIVKNMKELHEECSSKLRW